MNRELIIIEIVNWEKYQKRLGDIKRPWWFSLSNKVDQDLQVHILNHAERWAWISILCEASRQRKNKIIIEPESFVRASGNSVRHLKNCIKIIEQLHWIKVHPAGSRQNPSRTMTMNNDNDNNNTNYISPELSRTGNSRHFETGSCFPKDLILDQLLRQVRQKTQELWKKTYLDEDWITHELKQAACWCDANPSRKPKKNITRFLGAWLSRSWERHRKTLPSNHAPEYIGIAKILAGQEKKNESN